MAVVPFQNLPLADREREWDASRARKSVAKWASKDGSGDKDTIDWSRYRRAFLWYDGEEPENFGSYKLPIAEVIDGELRAVPRGIFAAAAVVQGARGGVDIPEDDIPAIRNHLSRYYAKMRREFNDESIVPPWEKEDFVAEGPSLHVHVKRSETKPAPKIGDLYYRSLATGYDMEVRESSDGTTTVFVINTAKIDRHGTVVDPAGINVEGYLRNPVVLFNHLWDRPPVARTINLQRRGSRWIAEVVWDEEDDFARLLKSKVKRGFLNAASIGFVPEKVECVEDEEHGEYWVIKRADLVEWSVVNAPSNPEAIVLQRSASDNRMVVEVAREIAESIRLELDERIERIVREIIGEKTDLIIASVRGILSEALQTGRDAQGSASPTYGQRAHVGAADQKARIPAHLVARIVREEVLKALGRM